MTSGRCCGIFDGSRFGFLALCRVTLVATQTACRPVAAVVGDGRGVLHMYKEIPVTLTIVVTGSLLAVVLVVTLICEIRLRRSWRRRLSRLIEYWRKRDENELPF